jgi:hypothetical protein
VATALLFAGLAAYTAARNPSRGNQLLALFTGTAGLWLAALAAHAFADGTPAALAAARSRLVPGAFLPVLCLHFVLEVTKTPARWVLRAAYAGSAVVVLLTPTPLLFAGVVQGAGPLRPVAGPLYPAFLALLLSTLTAALLHLARGYRGLSPGRQRQARQVIVGTAVGVGGATTTFLRAFGVPVPAVGHLALLLFGAFLGYAALCRLVRARLR